MSSCPASWLLGLPGLPGSALPTAARATFPGIESGWCNDEDASGNRWEGFHQQPTALKTI